MLEDNPFKFDTDDLKRTDYTIIPIQFFPKFWFNIRHYQIVQVFKKNTRSLSDDWNITIMLPKFAFKEYLNDWGEFTNGFIISAATEIKYSKVSYFWDFNARILGFGIAISHQTGY